MNLKIISWNVRRLNDRDKGMKVGNSLRMWKIDIVCLQETKLESKDVVRNLWGC